MIFKVAISVAVLLSFVGPVEASSQDVADRLAGLVNSKQCDKAERFVYKNLKGSEVPFGLSWIELSCRGNRERGIQYLKQSADMGNKSAQELLAKYGSDSSQGSSSPTSQSCDKVYGLDAMLEDQAKETQAVYNSHIDRASNESFAATLAGAAGQSFVGGAGAGMTSSGAPYRARVNDLVAERDLKLRNIRNQQQKLRYENPSCYP